MELSLGLVVAVFALLGAVLLKVKPAVGVALLGLALVLFTLTPTGSGLPDAIGDGTRAASDVADRVMGGSR